MPLPTTITGTRWVTDQLHLQHLEISLSQEVCVVSYSPSNPLPPTFLFSNSTVVGDKTPGGNTTSMPSITSTTPLLLHDGQHSGLTIHLTFLHLGTGLLTKTSWRFQKALFFCFISSPFLWFTVC